MTNNHATAPELLSAHHPHESTESSSPIAYNAISHFLPPITHANYNLLSRVVREKLHEEEALNQKRVENVQVSSWTTYYISAK